MASELFLAGTPVLRASITRPRLGLWSALLVVESGDVPSGLADLTDSEGNLLLRGTATRGAATNDRVELRLVAGAGGWGRTLEPRFYRNAPARIILADLVRETGETLLDPLDVATKTLLEAPLRAWTRERCEASKSLRQLCEALALSWRIRSDGKLWVGSETWQSVTVDHELLHDEPAHARVTLSTQTLPLAIEPGTVFLDQRVSLVEHSITDRACRTVVHFEREGALLDRFRSAFEHAIRSALSRVDYLALYPAKVVVQDASGLLEVIPDNTAIPPLTGVPLRLSIPGKVRVAAGARVLIGFDGGRPDHPYASLWESAALERAELGAATLGVARETDAVAVGRFVTVGSDRDLYWLPPGAGTNDWVAIPNQTLAPVLAGDGEAVVGKITGHSEKVFAE